MLFKSKDVQKVYNILQFAITLYIKSKQFCTIDLKSQQFFLKQSIRIL